MQAVSSSIRCVILASLHLLWLVALSPPASAAVQSISCSSTDSWVIVTRKGTINREQLRSDSGVLSWQFARNQSDLRVLATMTSINGFSAIRFDLHSKEKTTLVVLVEDVDGAKFHCPIPVEAAAWKHVVIAPADFKINEDSLVKKPNLDSTRVSGGFSIVDFALLAGTDTPNIIQLKNVMVEQPELRMLQVPTTIIGRTVEVKQDGMINANLHIGQGGVLRVKGARVRLNANIVVDGGGTLEFDRALVQVQTQFPHEREIKVMGTNSSISFYKCTVHTPYQISLNILERANLTLTDTKFSVCNLTVTSASNNRIIVRRCQSPGEFILAPGSSMDISDSEGVLLWPIFLKDNACRLNGLDSGSFISSFRMPQESKINLNVSKSKILWGLVAQNGCLLELDNCKMMAVGLQFARGSSGVISNLKNGETLANGSLKLSDRQLKFNNSTVRTWNLYVSDNARLQVTDCRFGEAMTFGSGRIDILNSTCDGTGGYVAAADTGTMCLKNCTLQCPVIAKGRSHLIVEKCFVEGGATASEDGCLELRQSKVAGKVQTLNRGTIKRQ